MTRKSWAVVWAVTACAVVLALCAPAPPAGASTVSVVSEVTASAPPTITVAAVGDMLFDSAPKRLIRAEGGKAPFRGTADILSEADVTVGNLECPISDKGAPVSGKTFTFRGHTKAVKGLKYAGFDLLAMGNNHARDYGGSALRDTFKRLKKAGIAYAGAGRDKKEAWRPAIIERNGATVAFLSFSQVTPASFKATDSRSGTAYTFDRKAIRKAISKAAKKADYVIVAFHWGVEKSYTANARQVSLGRASIRSGADLVLSHHPHRIQGVEFYRKGLIAYSLGNFVFSPGSVEGRDSMILTLQLGPDGVRGVKATPVWIGYDGRPRVRTGGKADRIIGIIKRTSKQRGSRAYRSGDVVKLKPSYYTRVQTKKE